MASKRSHFVALITPRCASHVFLERALNHSSGIHAPKVSRKEKKETFRKRLNKIRINAKKRTKSLTVVAFDFSLCVSLLVPEYENDTDLSIDIILGKRFYAMKDERQVSKRFLLFVPS